MEQSENYVIGYSAAKVICLSRNQEAHFSPLYKYFDVSEVSDWRPEALSELGDFDLLVSPSCDWYEAYACIQWAKQNTIPTLYIMDGILEWRHEWENPVYGMGDGIAFNQPIMTDKAACLGFASARTLEGWGNLGKCEVVGAARFDHYIKEPLPLPENTGAKKLLIMTANTPSFTSTQLEMVERSLLDIKEYLIHQSEWEPIWRVRKGLDRKLGLIDNFTEFRGKALREVMAQSHGVLSTPSTVLLEAMLAKRPTGILDYSNSPPYVSSGWTITSPDHIHTTLSDMLKPPLKRLIFQDEVLHNNLECYTPALPRLIKLINKMIQEGRVARELKTSLKLPHYILSEAYPHLPSPDFDFHNLYPNHPVFSKSNLVELQQELNFYRQENNELKRQLKRLRQRTILSTFIRKVSGK